MNRKSIEMKSMGTFQFELFNKLMKEKKNGRKTSKSN